MKVRLAVLADAANVSREGKMNILGQFDVIYSEAVPAHWPLMHLVIRLEATAGEGRKHKVGIRIVDEDGNLAGPMIDAEGEFGPPFQVGAPSSATMILGIGGATFQKHGTYCFEILVDGHNVDSIPLHVLPRPPQAHAAKTQ
jgi:hypothetical protein